MADSKLQNPKDVLESYRRWKEEGAALRERARDLLIARFHELVHEAQQVQQDLQEDFAHGVRFPTNPKPAKKGKVRMASRSLVRVPQPVPVSEAAPPKPSTSETRTRPAAAPKSAAPVKAAIEVRQTEKLRREVEKAKQRLEQAKASGSSVKIQNAEDRLYELSDELRLRTAPAE